MNRYDDFRPDVPALLKAQDAALAAPDPAARSGDDLGPLARLLSVLRLYGLGALIAVLPRPAWYRVRPVC